jgi:hypothetical protein
VTIALVMVPVPATIAATFRDLDAEKRLSWTDWPGDVQAFAAAHPEAVAVRDFEHYVKGSTHSSDVSVPCIHWLDTLGQVRVTTLEAGRTLGPCWWCVGDWSHLRDICPTCHGTNETVVYLRAGVTFIESLPDATMWRWRLLKQET